MLIAIALIELGMENKDAIELIRLYRKGAINLHQSTQLSKYKPITVGGISNKICCNIF